jgi:hypothetical protein
MSGLREELSEYLALRHSMGYKLRRAEKLLTQFVGFCEAAGAEAVTLDLYSHTTPTPHDEATNLVAGQILR